MTDTNTAACPMHAPSDHPKIKPAKVGVLVANLGTPDDTDYWSMRRYLNEFLSDKRVVDYSAWLWQPLLQLVILTKRPFSSGAAYKSIWNEEDNESPLLTITKKQTAAIKAEMAARYGDNVIVDFCMRYGNPSTKSKVKEMTEAGCQKILFFPLYPHYAGATSATANDQFFRALMEEKWQPIARVVEPYFEDPAYIDALAQSIERAYAAADKKPEKLICSYHGVPERYLREGDPYHCQCQKTARLVAEKLGLEDHDWYVSFQSRVGREEWLTPYTDKTLEAWGKEGVGDIDVICPAFSVDCLETLEEIAMEGAEQLSEAGGGTLRYIPCLNSREDHVTCLARLIERNVAGWPEASSEPDAQNKSHVLQESCRRARAMGAED